MVVKHGIRPLLEKMIPLRSAKLGNNMEKKIVFEHTKPNQEQLRVSPGPALPCSTCEAQL